VQQFIPFPLMYLIVIAWLYVALMMAVVEAASTMGTLTGAFFTFVLYGAAPVALVVYLMDTPRRKKAIKAREAAELARRQATASREPNAAGEAAADTVAPVREKL
jgi:heme exporter protein D